MPAPRFIALLLTLCPACMADTVFPGRQWEKATPESQQVDSKALQKAIDYLAEQGGSNGVRRLVIVRNGRMIWRGSEANTPQRVWSIAKAFTSTAHGLLLEDGKCRMETLAKDYDAELAENYPTVTLRHLATMTSGIDGVGGSYDQDDKGRADANALVKVQEPFFAPGTRYRYWDEATQHYGFVLTEIAGEPLEDYLRRRILQPIGISRCKYELDSTGDYPNWTGGLVISAADLARFGLLFLNHGRWQDQQLISSEWVKQATSVQVPPSIPDAHPTSGRKGSGVYGYHWWPNGTTPEGKRRWPHAPHGTYSRSGYNNNDLFVLPAWNMVVVRLGLDQSEKEITKAEYSTFLKMVGQSLLDPVVEGEHRVWFPQTLSFRGPIASETDDAPNAFLDYRLQVLFRSPSGKEFNVPGFFDGDGHGGGTGDVWRVRFTPDVAGTWKYQASFRTGKQVAVSLDPESGNETHCDGQSGSFLIAPRARQNPGFFNWGRLEYVGQHYLKFRDGSYWIRGGTDSPENFLAYAGFDDTPASHRYAAHVEDWLPGDPDWHEGQGRAIIGALNYLARKHVNSTYFLVMNVGGDGADVWPWVQVIDPKGSPDNDNLHYDISKLRQWDTVLGHAQRKGIFLHFVFNEAEAPNKRELDNGELGPERKLYYREIVARFGHHLALQWNLCEEYNIGFNFEPYRIQAFADFIQAVDPYDHPITVHSAGDPLQQLRFTFGDPRFSLTSIQLGQNRIDTLTESFRAETAKAGRPLPASLDEFTIDKGQAKGWIPVDDATRWRTEKLWPTLLSGGNIEFILGDLLETDSFKTPERDQLWDYVWFARSFLEALPFWEMQPADSLVDGEATLPVTQSRGKKNYEMGAQVFAKSGEAYAIYYPVATKCGKIDLSQAEGDYHLRWFNPRTGQFVGQAVMIQGGGTLTIAEPPGDAEQDWVVLIK